MITFIGNLEKGNVIYRDRKQISGCPGVMEEWSVKEHKGIFGVMEMFLYHDWW